MMDNGVVLVVLDGVGIAEPSAENAFTTAETPTFDTLFAENPYTELDASGTAVGLPAGYIGNSEVGHLHIGAGRTVAQDLVKINEAIKNKSLFQTDALQNTVTHLQEHGSTLHLMGIASDGGIHGHIDHMCALIAFFGSQDVDVVTHAFLDGRDVAPNSAENYLAQLQDAASAAGTGRIGSFMGRYYAMDRDENWDRTETAYRTLVAGEGRTAHTVSEGMQTAREQDMNDYFVRPTIITEQYAPVQGDDVVLFTNYRKDRGRQLTAAFVVDGFDHFPVSSLNNTLFVSMKPYDHTFDNPTLFDNTVVDPSLGKVISDHEISQLRLTESQKKAHVTYFFDGQQETLFPGTDTKIIPSAKVSSYDEKPEMEAGRITDYAVKTLADQEYGFILINYPNGDLVGHSGNMDAAVTAVETLDSSVSRLVSAAQEQGYTLILTADHGNCEKMRSDGELCTSHTLNKVPFCIVTPRQYTLTDGGLANVARTVLDVLNIESPPAFTESLISR